MSTRIWNQNERRDLYFGIGLYISEEQIQILLRKVSPKIFVSNNWNVEEIYSSVRP